MDSKLDIKNPTKSMLTTDVTRHPEALLTKTQELLTHVASHGPNCELKYYLLI